MHLMWNVSNEMHHTMLITLAVHWCGHGDPCTPIFSASPSDICAYMYVWWALQGHGSTFHSYCNQFLFHQYICAIAILHSFTKGHNWQQSVWRTNRYVLYIYAKHNNVILILCQRCAGVAPQIGHSPALDRADTDPVGETSHQHQLYSSYTLRPCTQQKTSSVYVRVFDACNKYAVTCRIAVYI